MGNIYLKMRKYEAIAQYNKAIDIYSKEKDDFAILYQNRTVAYEKLIIRLLM